MKISLKVAAALSLILSFTFYTFTLFMPDSYGVFVYFIAIVLFAVSANLGSRVVLFSRYFIVNLIAVSIVIGAAVSAIVELFTLAGGPKFEATNPLFVIMIAEF